MFLAGVTFTFLLPVVNKIDMSTNFALGALQVICSNFVVTLVRLTVGSPSGIYTFGHSDFRLIRLTLWQIDITVLLQYPSRIKCMATVFYWANCRTAWICFYIQVFGPFFLAAGILMLAFSFFGPSREVTVKWIIELQQYIGTRSGYTLYVLVIGRKTYSGPRLIKPEYH